ncbi:MAG: class I SAM-dependent methyltransferase [Candidatus Margulisbacteria bacterium]|nr:class I SAM-dependent methyltransferase [Candidatus Margulisiibacteriota bacterium]
MTTKRNITDYNDTEYEADFWGSRQYEDLVEKDVLQKFLADSYDNFLDLGAGFGRLAPVYKDRSQKATLLDYSDKLLASAKEKLGKNKNLSFVQGSFYELPFDNETFDGGCSVRVMHHVEDPDTYFKELNRVLKKDAEFILEVANKRNWLEIIRKLLGKKDALNPFTRTPENRSIKGLTYNFHPIYISEKLSQHGFIVVAKVDSSLLRSPLLKKVVGQSRLASVEKLIPFWMRKTAYTPSLFLKIKKI